MAELTEAEKKILRKAYEIQERLEAERLEAGEISLEEASEQTRAEKRAIKRAYRREMRSEKGLKADEKARAQRKKEEERYAREQQAKAIPVKGKVRDVNPKKKKHRALKVIAAILVILALLLAAVYVFIRQVSAQMNYRPYTTDYVRQGDVLSSPGVTNILLIGTDTRIQGSDDSRSDAMIVLSVNYAKRRLVMTSILRDSYVTIPGVGQTRINEAYQYGGPALLIRTIEENYKLGIDAYIQVDFFNFVEVIDAFGGVTIEVEQPELQYVNGYVVDYNRAVGLPDRDGFLPEPDGYGLRNLTGKQALAYARIRYIGTDFARTDRQRTVLKALLAKVKRSSPVTTLKAIQAIIPDLATNLTADQMSLLLLQSPLFLFFELRQARCPADGTWANAYTPSGQEVLSVDFGANKAYLQQTIYD